MTRNTLARAESVVESGDRKLIGSGAATNGE